MGKLIRTILFMPGNIPAMIQNAGVLGADSVILDLEDSVSLSEKDSARALVKECVKFIDFSNVHLVIRINPLDTEYGLEDLDMIACLNISSIMIPKVDEDSVKKVDEFLKNINRDIRIIPLIETAYGIENVYEIIKASHRVEAVLLGGEDLTADMGIKRTRDGNELFYARNKVATACRACRIGAIDTPFTDVEDVEGLKLDTINAKKLGMTGKSAINPRQVNIINKIYMPTLEEIYYAKRVIEAMNIAKKENKGVFSLDGKMIDAPIISRALNILETAGEV